MKKIMAALITAVLIFCSSPVLAEPYGYDRDLEVTADVVLVRPVSVAAIILGTAFFIVSLPFAIPTGSVGSAARTLVVEPFKYTFNRPIGDFGYGYERPATVAQPAPAVSPERP